MEKIKRFLREEEGLELSEYALMGALILLVGATIIGTLGTNIKNVLTAVAAKIVVPS